VVHPIAQGDRGPAVEDVQKRLLMLGFDLGPTGVDGVFWGATLTAVRRFQEEHGLDEDGIVGNETWAALVDATFRLGDRLLYLKYPYLHGADVRVLQGALNILGFACGEPDGIFGTYTERAVGEFQANVGIPADGIAGPETIGAVERLRHVWSGKDPSAPAELDVAPARAAEGSPPPTSAHCPPMRTLRKGVVRRAIPARRLLRVGLKPMIAPSRFPVKRP